jgi:hypothetical protein
MWMFDRRRGAEPNAAHAVHDQHTWWKVMCLTGVDYFSTLGYQPGIAFLAAGALSPLATCVLVLLTLFGALPMYYRVAEESPHGDGSISMLEHLLSRWKGKLFVLALLGFVATSFIITITLSAADATAHIVENPFIEHNAHFLLEQKVPVTLFLIGILGAVFLKGFKEAIGIAVVLVAAFLLFNVITIAAGLYQVIVAQPEKLAQWPAALMAHPSVNGNTFMVVAVALLLFPKLALGLSGFETGVVVMPLVRGDRDLTHEDMEAIHATQSPHSHSETTVSELLGGRIKNTKKLLAGAALIMSVMLISSSFATALLIPPQAFQVGGQANGRAISYIAHTYLGDVFGTLYDISTITILWFAGASAMAGLLNIVPRYLPRYGMAPDWARATRPLVFIFTAISCLVTIAFKADVTAQGGAYATGVLALMTSAAIAVTISAWRKKQKIWIPFLLITLVFIYTTIVNIIAQPEGLKIAVLFILGIVAFSLISRVYRSTELRVDRVLLDPMAQAFIDEAAKGTIRIVANRMETGDEAEYSYKEKEKREDNHIPASDPILFFEVAISDASEFANKLVVYGETVGKYKILRAESAVVPNAIAAFLLHLRNKTGKLPHAYFGWSEGNPIAYLLKYVAFGEGDTAPVTHEVLRQAERDPERRPIIHVGG